MRVALPSVAAESAVAASTAAAVPVVDVVRYNPAYASYARVELMDALVRSEESVENLKLELESMNRRRCRGPP